MRTNVRWIRLSALIGASATALSLLASGQTQEGLAVLLAALSSTNVISRQ